MMPDSLCLYVENPVGGILAHPEGWTVVEHSPGARKLSGLQAFLNHTGQLLQSRGWNRIPGDRRRMATFTEEEKVRIVDYWLSQRQRRPEKLYGAVILPHDAYASLSVSQVMREASVAALTFRLYDEVEEGTGWLRQPGSRARAGDTG